MISPQPGLHPQFLSSIENLAKYQKNARNNIIRKPIAAFCIKNDFLVMS